MRTPPAGISQLSEGEFAEGLSALPPHVSAVERCLAELDAEADRLEREARRLRSAATEVRRTLANLKAEHSTLTVAALERR